MEWIDASQEESAPKIRWVKRELLTAKGRCWSGRTWLKWKRWAGRMYASEGYYFLHFSLSSGNLLWPDFQNYKLRFHIISKCSLEWGLFGYLCSAERGGTSQVSVSNHPSRFLLDLFSLLWHLSFLSASILAVKITTSELLDLSKRFRTDARSKSWMFMKSKITTKSSSTNWMSCTRSSNSLVVVVGEEEEVE